MGLEKREICLRTKLFHKFWTIKHLTEMARNLFCGAFYHGEATYKGRGSDSPHCARQSWVTIAAAPSGTLKSHDLVNLTLNWFILVLC